MSPAGKTNKFGSRTPKKTAQSFNASSFVEVVVGEGSTQDSFLVHEGIICLRSEFFRRAMNGRWPESSDRVVKFPENCADTFGKYLNHVYTGCIPTMSHETSRQNLTKKGLQDETQCLCRLYILAEQLQDAWAKNAVMESLLCMSQEKSSAVPMWNAGIVCEVYAGTPRNCALRRFLVNECCNPYLVGVMYCEANKLPPTFGFDLALALAYIHLVRSDWKRHRDHPEDYLENLKVSKKN